jgi:hypothetical protein
VIFVFLKVLKRTGNGGMILTRKKENNSIKLHQCRPVKYKSQGYCPGANSELCSKKPATNSLSYGTAKKVTSTVPQTWMLEEKQEVHKYSGWKATWKMIYWGTYV